MSRQTETEEDLVIRAQQALSQCNWVIGECAAKWTKKYARGRTDADFGLLIGLSGDQVFQRRHVWETFSEVHEEFPNLKWSHFYLAVNWDDAMDCLRWADEMQATVSEMKAWRRAQRGEDLSSPGEAPPFESTGDFLSVETALVRDPDEFGHESGGSSRRGQRVAEAEVLAQSAARDDSHSSNDDYAPFGKGARGSAPVESTRSEPSIEQVVTRATAALERVVNALTPEVLDRFSELPLALQQRFLSATENLQSRAAGLS